MTKEIYTPTIARCLDGTTGGFNWSGWTIKAGLVSTGYTFSAAHADFTSISAHLLDESTVGTKSISSRSLIGIPAIWNTLLPNGPIAKGIVFFRETGTPATEFLLWYDDELAFFPYQTVGTPIQVSYPTNKLLEFPL